MLGLALNKMILKIQKTYFFLFKNIRVMLEVIEALAIKIYVSCTQSLPPARCPDFNRMKLEGRHNKKSTHTHRTFQTRRPIRHFWRTKSILVGTENLYSSIGVHI